MNEAAHHESAMRTDENSQRFITGIRSLYKSQPAKESVGKSRRDAMFIEKLEPIDLGEPIYGRTIVGCAPKGATTSRLCLPFYRHFTATRFFRRTPKRATDCLIECTIATTLCRPFPGLSLSSVDDPSTKVLGYYPSSAPRTAL